MSAREFSGGWGIACDDPTCGGAFLGETLLLLLLATSHATRSGWVTRSVTVDVDAVPRQRVEHYCPTHKGVAE